MFGSRILLGAKKLPAITSKRGNKNFYKGRGAKSTGYRTPHGTPHTHSRFHIDDGSLQLSACVVGRAAHCWLCAYLCARLLQAASCSILPSSWSCPSSLPTSPASLYALRTVHTPHGRETARRCAADTLLLFALSLRLAAQSICRPEHSTAGPRRSASQVRQGNDVRHREANAAASIPLPSYIDDQLSHIILSRNPFAWYRPSSDRIFSPLSQQHCPSLPAPLQLSCD